MSYGCYVAYNNCPVTPGAYLIDTDGIRYGTGVYPILCSIDDLGKINCRWNNDRFIVLPGYKLVVYNENGSSFFELDNTAGTNIKYYNTSSYINWALSVKLYYNGTEIKQWTDGGNI
jgi:hypothetical protein